LAQLAPPPANPLFRFRPIVGLAFSNLRGCLWPSQCWQQLPADDGHGGANRPPFRLLLPGSVLFLQPRLCLINLWSSQEKWHRRPRPLPRLFRAKLASPTPPATCKTCTYAEVAAQPPVSGLQSAELVYVRRGGSGLPYLGCFRKYLFGIPRNTEFYTELTLFRVIPRNFLLFNTAKFRVIP
jgi:hypothetical protein